MSIDPVEFLKLLEQCESATNRVRMFVEGKYTYTTEPTDLIPLEEIYDEWKQWRAKIRMPESEFRTHMRNAGLDIYEDGEADVLIGWAIRQKVRKPPATTRKPKKIENVEAALQGVSTIEGLAVALGVATRTLRAAMATDTELQMQVLDGLAQNKNTRAEQPVHVVSPEEILAARERFNPVRSNNRTPMQRLNTAQQAGFPDYESFAENVRFHKLYLIAKESNHPDTEGYWIRWQQAKQRLKAAS